MWLMDCVHLALVVLCLVTPQVYCEESALSELTAPDEVPQAVIDFNAEINQEPVESRGLWESDLFFFEKLSNLFGMGGEPTQPSRDHGLRPEHLPPQLFQPNRRRTQFVNNRVKPGIKPTPSHLPPQDVPYFQLPFTRPIQNTPRPFDSAPQHSQNVLAVHPVRRLPPPPPTPPSRVVTAPSRESSSEFPYKFIRPNGVTPSNERKPVQHPAQIPSKVQVQNLFESNKRITPKPVITKKPSFIGGLADLAGAFSLGPKPILASRPQSPQNLQSLQDRFEDNRQALKKNQAPPKSKTGIRRPHPRPAPRPQKHHPRPAPQPQRVNLLPQKPNAIHKKPILNGFKPSPQEGSLLADAFQPVFVASPSMDELGNDIMKPMHIPEARSAIVPTEKSEPQLIDFF